MWLGLQQQKLEQRLQSRSAARQRSRGHGLGISVQRATTGFRYFVYLFIFIWLLLFSALSIPYLYAPSPLQNASIKTYSDSNTTIRRITCAYPVSGQYGLCPQIIYFCLLPATFILRRFRWLAAGTAASALTYSGVAALHLLVLWAQHGRFDTGGDRFSCWHVSLGGGRLDLPICLGVYDPDYSVATQIVGAGLLAVLPISTWSTTFRNAQGRPILVLWTLLLAVGHVAYNLIETNPNPNYQICPAGHSELLPERQYELPLLNESWKRDLEAIVQGKSRSDNGCIYSCFMSDGYPGRDADEVGVYDMYMTEAYLDGESRRLSLAFWWIYAILSVVALRYNERHAGHLHVINRSWCGLSIPALCRRCLIRKSVQVISVGAFLGYLVWTNTSVRFAQAESFEAVGQWGSLAVVVLTLLAVVVSRLSLWLTSWGEPCEADDGIFLAEEGDLKSDWNCDVGYAS